MAQKNLFQNYVYKFLSLFHNMDLKYKCHTYIEYLILLDGPVNDLFLYLKFTRFFLKDVLRPLLLGNIRIDNMNC